MVTKCDCCDGWSARVTVTGFTAGPSGARVQVRLAGEADGPPDESGPEERAGGVSLRGNVLSVPPRTVIDFSPPQQVCLACYHRFWRNAKAAGNTLRYRPIRQTDAGLLAVITEATA